MTIDNETLVGFAALLISLIGGVATVPFINLIKRRFDISGRWAQLLTVAVAVILGIAILIAQGVLTPANVTFENAPWVLLTVLGASQAEFFRIKTKEPESAPEEIH